MMGNDGGFVFSVLSFGGLLGLLAGIFLMHSCAGFKPERVHLAEKLCESHGGLTWVEADEIHCKQLILNWPEEEQ